MRIHVGWTFPDWISSKVDLRGTDRELRLRVGLGQKLHSWQYKTPHGFEDKTVLVVGIGNSGADMVVELGRFAKQVRVVNGAAL